MLPEEEEDEEEVVLLALAWLSRLLPHLPASGSVVCAEAVSFWVNSILTACKTAPRVLMKNCTASTSLDKADWP